MGLGTEPVGGCLQFGDIVYLQEGVVVFAEAKLLSLQFLLYERVPVQPVGRMEGEKRCHTDDDRPQRLIANVEIVVGEAARLMRGSQRSYLCEKSSR
jgi:hypothetical protein